MSIKGDSTIDGNTADLDLNFKDDVLDNLAKIITLHFEAQKGDLLLFAEYQYVDLDPTAMGWTPPHLTVSIVPN
ncbi:MAG: hypothetical protein V7707_03160 [Motiliproteus sp.]